MSDPTPLGSALGEDAPSSDVSDLLAKAEAEFDGETFDYLMEFVTDLTSRPLGNRLARAFLRQKLAQPWTLDPRNQARNCRCSDGWKETPEGQWHPCPDCNLDQFKRWRLTPLGEHLNHDPTRCEECRDVCGLGMEEQ